MKKKKRKKAKMPDQPPEVRERHERTQKLLAERIAYYEGRSQELVASRRRST